MIDAAGSNRTEISINSSMLYLGNSQTMCMWGAAFLFSASAMAKLSFWYSYKLVLLIIAQLKIKAKDILPN